MTYLGRVRGNLAGYWAEGLDEPVWVFSNLEPQQALEVYRGRMKIEQSFRDVKGLLGLEKAMPKKLLIAFMLLAYAVGLLVGETIRAELYRGKRARGLFGALHPAQAPAQAQAQAIFEAHPAGP